MGNEKSEKEYFDNYKKYINQLKKEYKTTFEKIEVYINGCSKLNNIEKNNCLLQVLDTFLSAQVEGKSVKDITGKNVKRYCDNMVEGESVYIYKVSRIFLTILGALFYATFMNFFPKICEGIYFNDRNIIFQPMKFGIGECMLMLGYICIPKILEIVTRNYFEDPVRCKKVRKYTEYGIGLLTVVIYVLIKEQMYLVTIPFSNVILILIYLALINVVVWLLIISFEDKRVKMRHEKYLEILSRRYSKYLLKCEKHNKKALDWSEYQQKKTKENSIYTKLFFIYSLIFLVFVVIIGRGMLIKQKIDTVGIIILIIVSLLNVVIISVVGDEIKREKEINQLE